jgi:hypothetical protein
VSQGFGTYHLDPGSLPKPILEYNSTRITDVCTFLHHNTKMNKKFFIMGFIILASIGIFIEVAITKYRQKQSL